MSTLFQDPLKQCIDKGVNSFIFRLQIRQSLAGQVVNTRCSLP